MLIWVVEIWVLVVEIWLKVRRKVTSSLGKGIGEVSPKRVWWYKAPIHVDDCRRVLRFWVGGFALGAWGRWCAGVVVGGKKMVESLNIEWPFKKLWNGRTDHLYGGLAVAVVYSLVVAKKLHLQLTLRIHYFNFSDGHLVCVFRYMLTVSIETLS